MRVAFIARSSLYTDKGGDTVQIEKTAESLRKLGVHVRVYTANEKVDTSKYDILHLFNAIRPSDFLKYVSNTKKKLALSTIYVNYAETDKYIRTDFLGKLSRVLDSDALEYIKTVAKWILKGEVIASSEYLLIGHKRSIKRLLSKVDILLPNSFSEYTRIVKDYGIDKTPVKVIPNAVDSSILERHLVVPWKDRTGVLCVGRIEPRKNQLKLIQAANELGIGLTIIGSPGVNHQDYYMKCKEAAGDSVVFLGQMSFDELTDKYQSARVHILPSWFETTGLSSLEAGAFGCNVVVSDKGDTRDYFEDVAWFCEPDSVASIKEAITKAYEAPQNLKLREKIAEQYTWDITAQKTLEAYHKILKD